MPDARHGRRSRPGLRALACAGRRRPRPGGRGARQRAGGRARASRREAAARSPPETAARAAAGAGRAAGRRGRPRARAARQPVVVARAFRRGVVRDAAGRRGRLALRREPRASAATCRSRWPNCGWRSADHAAAQRLPMPALAAASFPYAAPPPVVEDPVENPSATAIAAARPFEHDKNAIVAQADQADAATRGQARGAAPSGGAGAQVGAVRRSPRTRGACRREADRSSPPRPRPPRRQPTGRSPRRSRSRPRPVQLATAPAMPPSVLQRRIAVAQAPAAAAPPTPAPAAPAAAPRADADRARADARSASRSPAPVPPCQRRGQRLVEEVGVALGRCAGGRQRARGADAAARGRRRAATSTR